MSKKLLVFAVMAMIAFGATVSMATESRLENLGGQGMYLMDDTNIFTNPATVTSYNKMLKLHMGGMGSYYGVGADMYAYAGGTVSPMENLVLGVFFARNPAFEEGYISAIKGDAITAGNPAYFTSRFDTPAGDYPIPYYTATWQNPFDIILGYKMGDISVGLSYYLANGKIHRAEEYDPGDDDWDETGRAWLHSVKLGVSADLGNMTPEAYFHWDPYSVKTTITYDEWDPEQEDITTLKGNKIVLGGRLFYELNDNVTIVPALNWEHVTGALRMDYDEDYGFDEEELTTDYVTNSVAGGVSVQYKADKLFVVGSASLLWSNFKVTDDTGDLSEETWTNTSKSFAAPVVAMGLEYQAMKMVTLRGGLKTTTIWASATELEDYTDDNADEEYNGEWMSTYQSTTASIGAALNFGNLVLDVTFGNFVLVGENGGYLGTGPNLFSALDAKYTF